MGKRGAWVLVFGALLGCLVGCEDIDPKVGALRPSCTDVDSNPAVAVDFVRDIRPLIDNKVAGTRGCIGCHAANSGTREGFIATGLDLTKLQLLRKGANDEVVMVPGKPCESLIVKKLQGVAPDGARMPKGGPYWAPDKIQLMIDWIAEGAQGADE